MTANPFEDAERRTQRKEDSYALDFAKVVEVPDDGNHMVAVRVVTDIGDDGVDVSGTPLPAFVGAPTVGSVTLPERGEFVVIGYLRGRKAYVVGSAYTSQQRAPSYSEGDSIFGNRDAFIEFRGDNAAVIDGAFGVVPKRTDDPVEPDDGAVWYRSDLDEYRGVEDGTTVRFDTTAV